MDKNFHLSLVYSTRLGLNCFGTQIMMKIKHVKCTICEFKDITRLYATYYCVCMCANSPHSQVNRLYKSNRDVRRIVVGLGHNIFLFHTFHPVILTTICPTT